MAKRELIFDDYNEYPTKVQKYDGVEFIFSFFC